MAPQPPSPPQSKNNSPLPPIDAKLVALPELPYTPPRSNIPAPVAEQHWDTYGDPSMYQIAPEAVYYSPQPIFARTPQYSTPTSTITEGTMHTRSGRAVGSPMTPNTSEPARLSQSPRRKRIPKSRIGKNNGPPIDQPLSVLTKDYTVPIRDMGAWVTRPVEARLKEAEVKGKIARPMNSFMLYRSAFADRVKKFCKENNHQVVSQVTGTSWPMEPKHIRDQYEKYAIIERDNHQAAHPNYKFAPNKNGKKRAFVDDDDVSDDDPDWEGSTRSTKRSRKVNGSRRGVSRSMTSTPVLDDFGGHLTPIQHYQPVQQLHPSSYHFTNPNGPQPIMVGMNGMNGHYYQSAVIPYHQNVEDVRYTQMHDPYSAYQPAMPVGLPDGNHHDLLSPEGGRMLRSPEGLELRDPRLAQVGSHYDTQVFTTGGVDDIQTIPRTTGYLEYKPQENGAAQEVAHPSMMTFTDGHQIWQEFDEPDFNLDFPRW